MLSPPHQLALPNLTRIACLIHPGQEIQPCILPKSREKIVLIESQFSVSMMTQVFQFSHPGILANHSSKKRKISFTLHIWWRFKWIQAHIQLFVFSPDLLILFQYKNPRNPIKCLKAFLKEFTPSICYLPIYTMQLWCLVQWAVSTLYLE